VLSLDQPLAGMVKDMMFTLSAFVFPISSMLLEAVLATSAILSSSRSTASFR